MSFFHSLLSTNQIKPDYSLLSNLVAIWDDSGLVVGKNNDYGEINTSGHLVKWKSIAPGPLGFDLTPASLGSGIVFTPGVGIVFNGTTQLQNITKSLYKFLHYNAAGISSLKSTVTLVVKINGVDPGNSQTFLTTNRGSISRVGYHLGWTDVPSNNNRVLWVISNGGGAGTPIINNGISDSFTPNQLNTISMQIDGQYQGRDNRKMRVSVNNNDLMSGVTTGAVEPTDIMSSSDSDVLAIGGTDAGANRLTGVIKAIIIQSVKNDLNTQYTFINSLMVAKGIATNKFKMRQFEEYPMPETLFNRFIGGYVRNPVNGLIVHTAYAGDSHFADVNKIAIGRESTDDGITHGEWFDLHRIRPDYIERYDPATEYSLDEKVSYQDGNNIYSYVSLANENVGNTPSSSPSSWERTNDTFCMDNDCGFDRDGNFYNFIDVHDGLGANGTIHKVLQFFYPYLPTGQLQQEPTITELTNIPGYGIRDIRVVGKMIQLDNGNLVKPIYFSNSSTSTTDTYVGISDDLGITWSWHLVEADGDNGAGEGAVCAVGNNIIFAARAENAPSGGWRFSTSSDGGVTWTNHGNQTFAETLITGHPIRLESFNLNGQDVIAAYFFNRTNRNQLVCYGKFSDVFADPVDGWNLNTKRTLFIAKGGGGGGYGGTVHFGGLFCRGITWAADAAATIVYNTWPHYWDGPTDHEVILISELGL